jgi:hypothetical protein
MKLAEEQQNKLNNRTADSRRVCHIHRPLLVCECLRELVGLLEDWKTERLKDSARSDFGVE